MGTASSIVEVKASEPRERILKHPPVKCCKKKSNRGPYCNVCRQRRFVEGLYQPPVMMKVEDEFVNRWDAMVRDESLGRTEWKPTCF